MSFQKQNIVSSSALLALQMSHQSTVKSIRNFYFSTTRHWLCL